MVGITNGLAGYAVGNYLGYLVYQLLMNLQFGYSTNKNPERCLTAAPGVGLVGTITMKIIYLFRK